MSKEKTWKDFVVMLHDLGIQNSSQEIATVINRNNDVKVSWQQVAGVRASVTRKSR